MGRGKEARMLMELLQVNGSIGAFIALQYFMVGLHEFDYYVYGIGLILINLAVIWAHRHDA